MERINNEFDLALPEGFALLSPEELAKIYRTSAPHTIGYRNEENGDFVVLSWRKPFFLSLRIADLRSAMRRVQSQVAHSYQNKEYVFHEYLEREYNGIHLYGFSFSFQSVRGKVNASVFSFKGKKHFYSLGFYPLAGKGEDLLDPLLSSLRA